MGVIYLDQELFLTTEFFFISENYYQKIPNVNNIKTVPRLIDIVTNSNRVERMYIYLHKTNFSRIQIHVDFKNAENTEYSQKLYQHSSHYN